jgi:hypothetical protein
MKQSFNKETTYCPLYSTRTTYRQEQPKENIGDKEINKNGYKTKKKKNKYYHNLQQTE